MIERCTKKRMLFSIGLLISISIIIVLLENHLTQNIKTPHTAEYVSNSSENSDCWKTENFTVIEACHPCTNFEIISKSLPACIPTGVKETVRCLTSGQTYRSCSRVPWLEERRFWTFEIISLVLGLVSSAFVLWRQKVLEQRTFRRIQRQINSTL